MIRYVGSFTIGGLMPQMVSLVAGVIPRLRAQAVAIARVRGQLAIRVPSLRARIAAAARVAAAVALQPPSVRFNVSANLAAYAAIQAQLKLFAKLQAALGMAGVELFLFDGTASNAGAEINGAIGAGLPGGRGTDQVYALVLATRYPATLQALLEIFAS